MNTIKAFFKEKGLYLFCLALIFGATAAGIFGIRSAMKNLIGPQTGTLEEDVPWNQPEAIVNNPVTDLPQPTSAPSAPPSAAPSPSGEPSQATAAPVESAAPAPSSVPSVAWPVENGEFGTPFSGNDLVYHATLGDWRTHNGTDYTGAAGAAVYAAKAGEVSAVYEDALWGTVVEVTGEDGIQWRYCGLGKAELERGAKVNAGTRLGTLGSIPVEADGGVHLHLERLQDGKWTDAAVKR